MNLSRHADQARVLKTLAVEEPPPFARLEEPLGGDASLRFHSGAAGLITQLTRLRQMEQTQMETYCRHRGCFMEFLARALDDPTAAPCGRCACCKGQAEALRRLRKTSSAKRWPLAPLRSAY